MTKNELVLVSDGQSKKVEALQSKIAELEERRRGLATKLDDFDRDRGKLALAAEDGDKKAKEALEKITTEVPIVKGDLVNAEAAIAEAHERLAEAEAEALRDAAKAKLNHLNAVLKERLSDVKEAERIWRELAPVLDRMAERASEIVAVHNTLRLENTPDGKIAPRRDELLPPSVLARTTDFLVDIGVGRHLDLRFAGTPRVSGAALAETEREVQKVYELSETEVLEKIETKAA